MASVSYVLTLLPLVLISCNIGYVRILFSAIYLVLFTLVFTKNYSSYWQLSPLSTIAVGCIIGLCNIMQVYFLFFYITPQPPQLHLLPAPRHNLHLPITHSPISST